MKIALHDAEMDHFGTIHKFPNFALMKLSAYHKQRGDQVEWFNPINSRSYDRIYSSKVFDFTPENPYLPEYAIRCGTGYGIFEDLPDEIDEQFPDYSIYPFCHHAIGFLTRGCIRNCRWCLVPKKEGYIHKYREWQDVVRQGSDELLLMDNNILACEFGIGQLEELSETKIKLDLNQGMDARLVTNDIAKILAKINWKKYIRFSCDQLSQIEPVIQCAELLEKNGLKTYRLFIYCLLTKDREDNLKRIYAMRKIKNATVYGMPEKNPALGIMPDHWQNVMAQKYIYSGQWRTIDWPEWEQQHPYYFKDNHKA